MYNDALFMHMFQGPGTEIKMADLKRWRCCTIGPGWWVSLQWLMAHNAYNFRYRVRNWHHYNQALIARGGITFWIDEAALTTWRNTQARSGSGAPRIYSDTAIHCAVVVKSVYCFSLRAAQGFVCSIMHLMRLDVPVPN